MKLKEWMFRNEKTIMEVAKAIGVTKSTIHKWKEGQIPENFRHLKRLEKYTNGKVMLEDLLMTVYSKKSDVEKKDHYDASDE
jgi:transcriptional regulator with XRE-family HTH domain